jgi:hypothetical protein
MDNQQSNIKNISKVILGIEKQKSTIGKSRLKSKYEKYKLEFKTDTKWLLSSNEIPAAEVMITDEIGFSIQSFANGDFLFCVHELKEGTMTPAFDKKYYQQELDPFYNQNNYGDHYIIEKCVDHLLKILNFPS